MKPRLDYKKHAKKKTIENEYNTHNKWNQDQTTKNEPKKNQTKKNKYNSKHGHAQTQKTKHVDKNKFFLQISPLHIISPTMCSPVLKGKKVGWIRLKYTYN